MTKLLVSVRNVWEAEQAWAAGASLIDVKEPDRGSLGATDPSTWREIGDALGGRVPLSLALGELTDLDEGIDLRDLASFGFAKVGLACVTDREIDWRTRWRRLINSLPAHIAPVAVAYADYQQCQAPSMEEVLEYGAQLGCRGWLLDTYCKKGMHLLDWVDRQALKRLIQRAQQHAMISVIGGSLGLETLCEVVHAGPDYVAVRGAVCAGDRRDRLSALRVRQLAQAVSRAAAEGRSEQRVGECG